MMASICVFYLFDVQTFLTLLVDERWLQSAFLRVGESS